MNPSTGRQTKMGTKIFSSDDEAATVNRQKLGPTISSDSLHNEECNIISLVKEKRIVHIMSLMLVLFCIYFAND